MNAPEKIYLDRRYNDPDEFELYYFIEKPSQKSEEYTLSSLLPSLLEKARNEGRNAGLEEAASLACCLDAPLIRSLITQESKP